MTGHLSEPILNALVDGELTADQLTDANRHLADCLPCTSQALHQSLLKARVANAGHRYAPFGYRSSSGWKQLVSRGSAHSTTSHRPFLWPAPGLTPHGDSNRSAGPPPQSSLSPH